MIEAARNEEIACVCLLLMLQQMFIQKNAENTFNTALYIYIYIQSKYIFLFSKRGKNR